MSPRAYLLSDLLGPPEVELAAQLEELEDPLELLVGNRCDPFTNTVRVTVMTLRRKLGEPDIIETLVGSGYRLCV